jgi:hypothetical protein
MFTATVMTWNEDRASVQHTGVGNVFFDRSNFKAGKFSESQWRNGLKGATIRYDYADGVISNVEVTAGWSHV